MTGASIETTLELWASSLREVKARDQEMDAWRQDRLFAVEQIDEPGRQFGFALRHHVATLEQEAADLVHH